MSQIDDYQKLRRKAARLENQPLARLQQDQDGRENRVIAFTRSWIEQIIHMMCSIAMWYYGMPRTRRQPGPTLPYIQETFEQLAENALIRIVMEGKKFAVPPILQTANDWWKFFDIIEKLKSVQFKRFALDLFKYSAGKLDTEIVKEIVNKAFNKYSSREKQWCVKVIEAGLPIMTLRNEYPDMEWVKERFIQVSGGYNFFASQFLDIHIVLHRYLFDPQNRSVAVKMMETFPEHQKAGYRKENAREFLACLFLKSSNFAIIRRPIEVRPEDVADLLPMLHLFIENGYFPHYQEIVRGVSKMNRECYEEYFLMPIFDLLDNVHMRNLDEFFDFPMCAEVFQDSLDSILFNSPVHIQRRAGNFLRKFADYLSKNFKSGKLFRCMRTLTGDLIDSENLELMTMGLEMNFICDGRLVHFTERKFRLFDNKLKERFSSENCYEAKLWLAETEWDGQMNWTVADQMFRFFEIRNFLENNETWYSWEWNNFSALLKIILSFSSDYRRRNGTSTNYPEHHKSSLELIFFWCLTMIKEFGNVFGSDFKRFSKEHQDFRYEEPFEYNFLHNEKVRGWEEKFRKTVREECRKSLEADHYQRNTKFQEVLELITEIMIVNLDSWSLKKDLVFRARQYISECIRPMFMMNGLCAIRISTALEKNILLRNIWSHRNDRKYRQEVRDTELRVKAIGAKVIFREQNYDLFSRSVLEAIKTIDSRSDGEIVDFDHCVEAVAREQQIYDSYEVIQWVAMKF